MRSSIYPSWRNKCSFREFKSIISFETLYPTHHWQKGAFLDEERFKTLLYLCNLKHIFVWTKNYGWHWSGTRILQNRHIISKIVLIDIYFNIADAFKNSSILLCWKKCRNQACFRIRLNYKFSNRVFHQSEVVLRHGKWQLIYRTLLCHENSWMLVLLETFELLSVFDTLHFTRVTVLHWYLLMVVLIQYRYQTLSKTRRRKRLSTVEQPLPVSYSRPLQYTDIYCPPCLCLHQSVNPQKGSADVVHKLFLAKLISTTFTKLISTYPNSQIFIELTGWNSAKTYFKLGSQKAYPALKSATDILIELFGYVTFKLGRLLHHAILTSVYEPLQDSDIAKTIDFGRNTFFSQKRPMCTN